MLIIKRFEIAFECFFLFRLACCFKIKFPLPIDCKHEQKAYTVVLFKKQQKNTVLTSRQNRLFLFGEMSPVIPKTAVNSVLYLLGTLFGDLLCIYTKNEEKKKTPGIRDVSVCVCRSQSEFGCQCSL